MTRSSHLTILAMLTLAASAALAAGPPGFALADDGKDDKAKEEVPELAETRLLIGELKLDEAQDALKVAKKGLGSRKRDKAVKAELKVLRKNLDALEEFLEAKKNIEKGRAAKALKPLTILMRMPGELIFLDHVTPLYSQVKGQVYYVINDFETEAFRRSKMFRTKGGKVTMEVVSDLRLSLDGRHSLKVNIAERGQGVQENAPEAWRYVQLKVPSDFGEKLPAQRAFTFGIYSPKKQQLKLDFTVTTGSADTRATYAGITLNFIGWKTIQVPLNKMKRGKKFEWAGAKSILLETHGAFGGEFYIDDVKLIR